MCRLNASAAINRKQAVEGLRDGGRSDLVMGCQVVCYMKLGGLFEALIPAGELSLFVLMFFCDSPI